MRGDRPVQPIGTTGTGSAVAVGPQLSYAHYFGIVIAGGNAGAGDVVVTRSSDGLVIDVVALAAAASFDSSVWRGPQGVIVDGGISIKAPTSTVVTAFVG